MTSYISIELMIIAAGLVLFGVSFCGFLRNWIRYTQDDTSARNEASPTTTGSKKCVLHEDCPANATQGFDGPFYSIDLPPSYEDALNTPQQSLPKLDTAIVLDVDKLPAVHQSHVASKHCELA